ncbi:MAG: hypothetical protein AAFV88_12525, partial [Planctomycetota bacterium]
DDEIAILVALARKPESERRSTRVDTQLSSLAREVLSLLRGQRIEGRMAHAWLDIVKREAKATCVG